MSKEIPRNTIETLARSIHREAADYGFGQVDFIRLVNELMDLSANPRGESEIPEPSTDREGQRTIDVDVSQLPIRGPSVTIRDYREATDRACLESWLPDRYGRYFVLSCATAQAITIDSLINDHKNRLGIVTDLDDRPIGAMAFLDITGEQRRAELRKLIGDPAYRGQGVAEEATRLWIQYGRQALGLEKIYVSTLQTHIGNVKLNESVGFRVEGVLRNEVRIDGRRFDVLRMGIWDDVSDASD